MECETKIKIGGGKNAHQTWTYFKMRNTRETQTNYSASFHLITVLFLFGFHMGHDTHQRASTVCDIPQLPTETRGAAVPSALRAYVTILLNKQTFHLNSHLRYFLSISVYFEFLLLFIKPPTLCSTIAIPPGVIFSLCFALYSRRLFLFALCDSADVNTGRPTGRGVLRKRELLLGQLSRWWKARRERRRGDRERGQGEGNGLERRNRGFDGPRIVISTIGPSGDSERDEARAKEDVSEGILYSFGRG